MSGTLYGIGIGPGDPELLTLKAVRLLARLPVLAWPAPLEGEGMARTIAASHIGPGKIEIAIRLSFAPGRSDADQAYDAAALAIAGHLEAGRDVGLLCEGDPLFFGSFAYVLERLEGRFPIQVVPGVSSVMAAAAALARPLALQDERLAIIPSTLAEDAIAAMLEASDAAALMKVGRHLPKLRRVLKRLGLEDRAFLAERVGLEGERLIALPEVDQAFYFSLILVRKAGP